MKLIRKRPSGALPRLLTALLLLAIAVVGAWSAPFTRHAEDVKAPYPSMAPLDQYLIADRNAEIALARSAAPESISRDAEVLVLGRHGYETAVKGTNGFLCIVERSWTKGIDDPDFWNPKLRAPICFNAPAVRSYLPLTLKKTELVLAGRSKTQMFEAIQSAIDKKELPPLESNAMCYMMSKEGNLSDSDGHWHPHLMFFIPQTDSAVLGADRPGSPIVLAQDPQSRVTVLMVPVGRWSDGTAETKDEH